MSQLRVAFRSEEVPPPGFQKVPVPEPCEPKTEWECEECHALFGSYSALVMHARCHGYVCLLYTSPSPRD
eukprot:11647936-Alexandrium_andersonii.AAC.1